MCNMFSASSSSRYLDPTLHDSLETLREHRNSMLKDDKKRSLEENEG